MLTSDPQRVLYLHIGTEKTGTSTLQLLGHENRKLLADHGLLYPHAGARVAHAGLTLYALEDTKRNVLLTAFGLQSDQDVVEFRATLMGKLRAEVNRKDCPKILLSNEHLSSRVTEVPDIQLLIDGLRTVCPDIRVIVYLRPQHELVLSMYSTAVKGGRYTPLRIGRKDHTHYYNFDLMLSCWEAVVGIDNITVRLFQPEEFFGGTLIDDFFHTLGMATPAGLKMPDKINKSYDADTLQFARIGNEILPKSERKGSGMQGGFLHALAQVSTGPKFTAAGSELAELDESFRLSNARVARRYFPDRNGVLFAPFTGTETPDPPELTPERAVEIAIGLWRNGRQKKARETLDKTRRKRGELPAGGKRRPAHAEADDA
jgi:hypothetical protein